MKKLSDTLIIAAAAGFCIIGIDQSLKGKFAENYWLFMLTFSLLTWYMLRKKKAEEEKQ